MNITMFICGALVGGVSYLVLRKGKKSDSDKAWDKLKEQEALAKNKRKVQKLEYKVRKNKR